MRGKKTLLNTLINLLLQVVSIISSFILPRLILSKFGSQYNGLTSSISQFLACAVLLRSGIGGATRAALYKPLAEKNKNEINSIMKATDIFMKKIALILLGLILLVATIYPFFTKDEFSWFFTFSLFLIIGISTFAESLFGITYLILLQADQKLWIASSFRIISVILNVILATTLILNDFSIHIVKLGSAIAFALYPLLLNIYVKRKYNINLDVEPNNKAIGQRWDAFWHQVATFVNSNTDIIVLTLFTNMLEVSVYSVYNMVSNAIKNIVMSFSNGLEAAFGNMIAKNENELVKENLSIIEFIIYNISTIIYVCAIVLIIPFVRIYTKGINDVNYIRLEFSYIILIAQFFYTIRIPYQMIVQAAGHYKQTKNGAMIEALLNIGISVILVINYGIIGVGIGTLVAMLFRTMQLANYTAKNIVKRSVLITIKKCMISFFEGFICIVIINKINLSFSQTYLNWIINAFWSGIIVFTIVGIGALIFYRDDFKRTFTKLKRIFYKNKV